MNKVSPLPVDCARPGCPIPLSPNLIETKCKHVFHQQCVENWVHENKLQAMPASCPTCRTDLSPIDPKEKSTINPCAECSMCMMKLQPDVVVLSCNDGLHSECLNLFYSEKVPLDKCPRPSPHQHSINFGARKIYTSEEYAALLSSKASSPPKPPVAQVQQTSWLGTGWKMFKGGVLVTTVVWGTKRLFF